MESKSNAFKSSSVNEKDNYSCLAEIVCKPKTYNIIISYNNSV